jgi:hypothetical protein
MGTEIFFSNVTLALMGAGFMAFVIFMLRG